MRKLRFVGVDAPLITEQGLKIRDRIVVGIRDNLVARKLCPLAGPLGPGVQTFGYDKLTEVSDARLDFGWPGAESLDIVNLARETVPIPNLHAEFEINKLDLLSSQMTGQPLNYSVIDSKTYKVALLEDQLLMMGWKPDGTNYIISGFYTAAGNDENTGLDWGTKANIETSMVNALGLMLADKMHPPFDLTLNGIQYAQAAALIANSSQSYLSYIKEVIKGEIYISPSLVAGTGLLSKKNNLGMFEYVLAEDVTSYTEPVPRSGNLFGKIYVRGLPIIYESKALCKLSNI